ncbi:hypothetical protein GLOTRDRAFT_132647 [Gloeophyllum trabeum ATCC 11539]|uniref:Uncharacterized protein n=1 Tax=Gloeophyllum trabeum (strain ATCC 11539 / FP-39264 / Madison 617) TaxID=670483 RepID=S7PW30_GLOTA|nr:uncharacterized protein GLOTRDRAFT_132647 [Gloeophyllum trabeum ATCC 11539]EPQ51836.1 hypothetical protein GLOTRDRAFT_132647 [Gloeophyllum trabeum ATCC 11539]
MASHPTSERLTFERRDGRLGPAIGMHTAFSGLPATFTGSTGTKHRGEHPRLVSPRAYLSSPISARKRDVGLQSQIGASFRILESDISGNTEGRDPVAALEVYKWPQEFDLSYDYCFDLVLLRLRSSLIDSSGDTDLADHSSILAKYIDPVLNFVNRDIFDPHGANGPLIYREVQTGIG